jgi:hypothetical protein
MRIVIMTDNVIGSRLFCELSFGLHFYLVRLVILRECIIFTVHLLFLLCIYYYCYFIIFTVHIGMQY